MDRLKVLIVDDEHLIRNLLKMRIDWEGQGMSIVGEAAHAYEALDLVRELKPDIIFTDINMPYLDGIEFSRMVLEEEPQVKIVIVTGHDEFEYARRSIKLGISDFILKPIRAAELMSVTDKLRHQFMTERTREEEYARLKLELAQAHPYLKERFVSQWLNGTLTKEDILEKAAYFGIPLSSDQGTYQVAVVLITSEAATDDDQAVSEERSILLEMSLKNRIESFYRDDTHVLLSSDHSGQLVILSINRDSNMVSESEKLLRTLINAYACDVSIGVGRRYDSVMDVGQAYREAIRALQDRAFVGKNQVIYYEDVIGSRGQPYRSNPERLQELQLYISAGQTERASEIVRALFSHTFTSVSEFRMAAMDVITQCQHAAIEQQLEDDRVFDQETLISIVTSDDLPRLLRILDEYVRDVSRVIHDKNAAKEGDLVSRVTAYLENHLSDPSLSLSTTAERFFVSPGHLGRLMKKETGQTFVEFLTNIRMKKAEMLLRETDLKNYQVGEQVGIPDPHYFSIVFKKTLGLSASEYRNSFDIG